MHTDKENVERLEKLMEKGNADVYQSGAKDLCAYCRSPQARSPEEEVERIKKLMEKGNADAFYQLGGYYADGDIGLPQDRAKEANELYLKAGQIGSADACYNLGNAYRLGRGVEIDEKKAKHYWESAAMNGSVIARHNIATFEGQAGNNYRAIKHLLIAANAVTNHLWMWLSRGL